MPHRPGEAVAKMKCCQKPKTGWWRYCPYCGARLDPPRQRVLSPEQAKDA